MDAHDPGAVRLVEKGYFHVSISRKKGPKDWVPGEPLSGAYKEIRNLDEAVRDGGLDIDALWKAVGRADLKRATQEIEGAGFDLDTEIREIVDIRLIAIPDDILGDRYRAWIKFA